MSIRAIETRTKDSSDLPLGKIIVVVLAIGLIAGLAFKWAADQAGEKKADELLVLAEDHFRLNQPEQGLQKINQALKLKEKPEYLKLKVDFLINQNKVYEADQALSRLIEFEPKNAHYRYLAATLALNEDDLEKATAKMREAMALEPTNARYEVDLANLLMRNEQVDEAKRIYENVIREDPKYQYGWSQYATALSNAGRHEEAVAVQKRALKLFPQDSDFHFLLATIYDNMGKKQEAATAYRRSLELEPMPDSIAARRIFEITGKHVPVKLEQMVSDQVPFESKDKLMFVEATVNGRTGRFLVDTGASLCVLFARSANKFNLTPSPFKAEVETAGGTIQVPMSYGTIRLGRFEKEHMVFGVNPDIRLDADGIIGMNFLEHFRMEVDKSAGKISLTQ